MLNLLFFFLTQKQLQDISSGSSSAPKKAAAKPAPKRKSAAAQDMDIDIDSFVALAQGDDDDVHVDFDENDLSDPRLLVSSLYLCTHAFISLSNFSFFILF